MTENINNESITEQSPVVTPAETTPKPPKSTLEGKMHGWVDALFFIVIFFVAQVIGGVLCLLLGVEMPGENLTTSFDEEVLERAASIQARFVAITYLLSMVAGFAMLWLYGLLRSRRAELSFRGKEWGTPIRLLNGYLLIWCISIAIEPLTASLPGDQSALGGGGWLLFSAVLLAPVFEEILFRGYIAGALRRSYGGAVAWVVSALAFGVAHLIPSVIISASLMGLVLGYYALRYRSLWLAIVLHAMNNATACFLRIVDMEDLNVREMMGGGTAYWVVYGVATTIAVISLVRMARSVNRIKSDNYHPEM